MLNFTLNSREKKKWIELSTISILYVLPIILANRYYNDDLSRSLTGLTGWSGDGRPVTEYLMRFLCGGMPIADIAPLPLIASVLLLSYSLIVYAKENLYWFKRDIIFIYGMFLVLANPFMLSNLSYRYDCISMVGAMAAVFIFYSVKPFKLIYTFIVSVTFGILLMALYQPVLGICLGLFVFHMLFWLLGHKKNIQFEVVRTVGVGSGAMIYVGKIAQMFIDQEGWRKEASRMVFDGVDMIKQILINAFRMIKYIVEFMTEIPGYFLVFFGVLFVASWIYMIIYSYQNCQKWKKTAAIYTLFLPILVLGCSILPLVFLQNLSLKSRIFISFSVCMLMFGIFIIHFAEKHYNIVLLCIPCLIFQFSYMYSYGNALADQKEYETYMVYNIAHDIEVINREGKYPKIAFVGNMPKSRRVQLMCEKYPSFDEIIPVYLNNDLWIGGVWLCQYLQEGQWIEAPSEKDISVSKSDEAVIENAIYNCYINGDKIIVSFDK